MQSHEVLVDLQYKEVEMCAFCAAVPATLAIGANLNTKQLREQREAMERGETLTEKKQTPVGKITILVAGALIVASAVYHSRFNL